MEWSFCGNGWASCDDSKLAERWRPIVSLIRTRNVSILEEWYSKLLIDELLPGNQVSIDNIRKGKWTHLTEKEAIVGFTNFNFEDQTNWLSIGINTGMGKLSFHVWYKKYENPANLLKPNAIKFGIYDKQGEIIEEATNKENFHSYKHRIETSFTLMSHDKSSYYDLVFQMRVWLQGLEFPKEIQTALNEAFDKSISSKFNA